MILGERYLRTLLVALMIVGALTWFASCTRAEPMMRIKIVAHSETTGMPHAMEPIDKTTTVYAQAGRIRIESPAFRQWPATVVIQRCDAHVIYALNTVKREYTESPMPSREQQSKAAELKHPEEAQGQPNLVFETVTVDTGQTRSAFGHKAHHYITTTKQIPSPELDEQPGETVVDAWYLDSPDVMTCPPASHRPTGLLGSGRTMEKIRPAFRYSGPEPQGLVLSEKRTSRSVHVLATGEKQQTALVSSHEIVEMSEMPTDPKLFEVPSGFTKVDRLTR